MKCPKCGYNSFEYHSICQKCSGDLGAFKQTHDITPLVLPPEAREKKSAEFMSSSTPDEHPADNMELGDDMFSFDLPEIAMPASKTSPPKSDDLFNFDAYIPEVMSKQAKAEIEGFAELLASTAKPAVDPFASLSAASSTPQAKPETQMPGLDEYDLESFSWDDTPPAGASTGEPTPADDFDTLFGNTDDNAKK